MKWYFILAVTCLYGFKPAFSSTTFEYSGGVTDILNKITDNYDKRVRPDYGEKPVEINITMYVLRGMEMSEKTMSWKIQYYFRQAWQDRRLSFNFPGISNITVGPEMARKFWQPDTFFPASTSTKLKSDENVFFRIRSDGTILTSAMVTTESFCPMDLRYFPHDRQRCTLDIESYGYTMTDIKYQWKDDEKAIGFDPNIHFEDHKIVHYYVRNHEDVLSTGRYSRVSLKVELKRNSGYFARQFFLPSCIFAILTWLSFWIPESSKFFRGLGVLSSLLTYWILSYRASQILPRLEYSTRLEQYTTTCLVLSLFAVAEFIAVLSLSRGLDGRGKSPEDKNGDLNKEIADPETGSTNNVASYFSKSFRYVLAIGKHRQASRKVDLLSKIVYPIIFIVFNIWYWASLPSST